MLSQNRVGRKTLLGGVSAGLALVASLSACQIPLVGTGPSSVPPSVPLVTPSSSEVSTPPPETSDATNNTPGPSSQAPIVLIKDDGTGVISMNMTPTAFHETADALGWVCSPKSGTDKYGDVTVGSNTFNFVHGTLQWVSIGDPHFATEKGLRVGDSVGKMLQLYGTPGSKDTLPDDGGELYSYSLAGSFGIGIAVKSGTISSFQYS